MLACECTNFRRVKIIIKVLVIMMNGVRSAERKDTYFFEVLSMMNSGVKDKLETGFYLQILNGNIRLTS